MSFAFMPLYVGDYLRDTRHLSALRHGIYLLLLMHCWAQRGPLPLDEQECCGIANCRSADEVDALRYVLSRFFVKMEDGWYNKRMQLEVERAESISRARSNAGRHGYQAKAKQLLSKCLASASTPTTTTTATTTSTSKVKTPMSEFATRMSDDAVPAVQKRKDSGLHATAKEVLFYLNAKTGRHFRATENTLKPIVARLKEGYTVPEIRAVVARKCRDWAKDDHMRPYLRPETLFNATKFSSYVGEVPPPEPQEAHDELPGMP